MLWSLTFRTKGGEKQGKQYRKELMHEPGKIIRAYKVVKVPEGNEFCKSAAGPHSIREKK